MMSPDGLIEIMLGTPDKIDKEDPCSPGHHGPVEGPSDAEEALMKIKHVIMEYFGEKLEEDDNGVKEKLEQCAWEESKEE